VAAVTVNHEGIPADKIPAACNAIREETGLPAFDVLTGGLDRLMETLFRHFPK